MRIKNLFEDMIFYGIAVTKIGIRKWYNPLRWVFKKDYHKQISLKEE